jgi:hypothetical protein
MTVDTIDLIVGDARYELRRQLRKGEAYRRLVVERFGAELLAQ